MKELSLIPENIAAHPEKSKLAALAFAEQCQDDLPDGHSLATYSAELNRWCDNAVTSSEKGLKLPSSLVASVALAKSSLSPCIERLLSVIAVLPVRTCSCERSFSSLRRLKTYLRTTMMRPRLDGLALMHDH